MKFLAFAASHRKNSYNLQLLQVAAEHLLSKNILVECADYSEFDMPMYNAAIHEASGVPEQAKRFAAHAASAQGVIIASPEYNWSYPGSLKNIIDWTSCLPDNPLAGRTALLISASTGSRGGILGLNHLKTPLEALQMVVYPTVFPLGNAHSAFDGEKLANKKQYLQFTTIIDNYVTFSGKLSNN